MTDLQQEAEQIEKDYKQFRELTNKITSRKNKLNKMLDHFEERLLYAPASSRKEYHLCRVGGLLNHSLRVCANTLKLAKVFDFGYSEESLIISSLYHDFGKIGAVNEPYYMPNEDQWQIKQGRLYKINPKLTFMPDSLRCLWLFQEFEIKLSEDEYLAILLNNGTAVEENRIFQLKNPNLSVLVHMADYLSCKFEKEHNL